MSILDGLPRYPEYDNGERGDLLDEYDVREALTNPTDEQIRGILARLRWADTDRTVADVRRVLTAAAGGDQ